MIWDYTLPLIGGKLLPVGTLKCPALAIEIVMLDKPPGWNRAGYLYPLLSIGGGDIPASSIPINFDAQIIQVPYRSYKLRFEPVKWLTSKYTFKLFKINMAINYPNNPTTSTSGTVTTVAAAAVSTVISAPNANRLLGGMIINKTNRRLWIRFDATAATAASPSIDIPANGGSVDISDGFIGQITGIWEAGATGSCTIIEYLAS